MDQIEIIRNTPLRFHKIYVLFFLPIGLLGNGILLFQSFRLVFQDVSAINIFTVIERVLYVFLTAKAFKGLLSYKRSGVYSVFALQGLSIMMSIAFGVIMLGSDTPMYGYSYLLSSCFSALIILYYAKRLKAFSKNGLTTEEVQELLNKVTQESADIYQPEEEAVYEEEEEELGKYDCPRCGLHITDGSVFCPKCGAQLRKVNH